MHILKFLLKIIVIMALVWGSVILFNKIKHKTEESTFIINKDLKPIDLGTEHITYSMTWLSISIPRCEKSGKLVDPKICSYEFLKEQGNNMAEPNHYYVTFTQEDPSKSFLGNAIASYSYDEFYKRLGICFIDGIAKDCRTN